MKLEAKTHEIVQTLLQLHGETEPGDIQSTLNVITECAEKFFKGDLVVALTINPNRPFDATDSETYTSSRGTFLSTPQAPKPHTPREGGIIDETIEKGVLYVNNLDASEKYRRDISTDEQIKEFVVASLVPEEKRENGKGSIGVIFLNYREKIDYDDVFRYRLESFANVASLLLQRTRSYKRSSEVSEIGQLMNAQMGGQQDIFGILCDRFGRIFDERHFLLLANYRPQRDSFLLQTYQNQERSLLDENPLGSKEKPGLIRHVLFERKTPWLIKKLSREREHEDFPAIPVKVRDLKEEAMLFVPLYLKGAPLGAISVQADGPYTFSEEDLRVLEVLGNQIAVAINTKRLFSNNELLNRVGAILTQRLRTDVLRQRIVDQTREITLADSVVLYEYKLDGLFGDPVVSGEVGRNAALNLPVREDLRRAVLDHNEPLFVQSHELYDLLPSRRASPQGFINREGLRSTAAIPLLVEEEPVGVLFVNFKKLEYFDAPLKLLIKGLASYAAIAIRNQRTYRELELRRSSELGKLKAIEHAIVDMESDNGSPQAVLDAIVEQASNVAPAQSTILFLIDKKKNSLVIKASEGARPEQDEIPLNETRGIAKQAVVSKKTKRVNDVLQDENYIRLETDTVIRSEIAVPLTHDEEVIGILNLESEKVAAFSSKDQLFLEALAESAAIAIQIMDRYEREQREVRKLQRISKIVQGIITQLDDYEEVVQDILTHAIELTGAEAGDLDVYKDSHLVCNFEISATRKEVKKTYNPESKQWYLRGITAYVAQEKIPYLTGNAQTDPHYKGPDSIHSEATVPLMSHGELVGVLNVESSELYAFSEGDFELLKLFAASTTVAIQNAANFASAEEQRLRFQQLFNAGKDLGDIATELDVFAAYQEAYKVVLDHIQAGKRKAVIRRFEEGTNELYVVDAAGLEVLDHYERLKVGEGANGYVALQKEPLLIADTEHTPFDIELKLSDPNTRTLLVVPIINAGVYYGNISLSSQEENGINAEDQQLIEGLAQLLAITLHRIDAAIEAQEAKRRQDESLVMSLIGQGAFELAHRLGNDLGLIRSNVNNARMAIHAISPDALDSAKESLDLIVESAKAVMALTSRFNEDADRMRELNKHQHIEITLESLIRNGWQDLLDRVPESLESRTMYPIKHLAKPESCTDQQEELQVELVLDIAIGETLVRFNPEHFVSIFRNIITNAADAICMSPASRPGVITISASMNDTLVELDISDSGPGIEEGQWERIFHLFYSSKKSSGFGLWSSKRYALINQGDLEIKDSHLDRGTTFVLTLPKVQPHK